MKRSLRRRYSAARTGGTRESRALRDGGEGHGSGVAPGSQPRGTPRRMGRGTLEIVAPGTGEALPGPAPWGNCCGAWRPITDDLGKWTTGRKGVGGGRSTDRAERTNTTAGEERAAASSMRRGDLEGPGECRFG